MSISRFMEFKQTGEFFEEKMDLERLIRFIYGLSTTQSQILKLIYDYKTIDSESLTRKLQLRSKVLVNKALKHLFDLGIITRKKISIDGRSGYHYVYSPLDPQNFMNHALNRINEWYQHAQGELALIPQHFTSKLENPDEITETT